MDTAPESALWKEITAWARKRGVPTESLAASNTRTKLRSGSPVAAYVYRKIEEKLGWVDGDAARCARDGTPPRPVEGETDEVERLRVELMRTAGDIVIAAAGAGFPALQEAKGLADQALRKLRPDT